MERARVACGERKGRRDPGGFPPGPLTGVCCDGSPERLVDPCLELNLFHDSANLPRLALRLHLRLSPPSSRSEPPRSISAASRHFFPMRSSPLPAGQHPGGARGSRSLLWPQVSLPPRRSSLLAPPLPPPAPARAPRSVTAVATRLRLRPRLAPRGWDGERHLHRSQLPFAPQISLRPKSHGPHLGLLTDAPLGSYPQSPDPAQSPRPGDQPHPTPSCRCKPGSPTLRGWRLPGLGERQEVDNFVLPPVSFSPFSWLMQQLPPKCPPGE